MTKDEIIRMACEAHGPLTEKWWDMDVVALERFANLVAAAEREACMACYSPDDSATDWMDKIKARSQS